MHAIITLLFAHWVADFLFQSNTMALNKSTSVKWLSLHVLTYSTIILIFVFFLLPWKTALIFAVVNAVLHWITDFFTSKLTTAYKDDRRYFFLIIGLDQFIHAATLIFTLDYVMTSL
jgi:hypothetical protein